MSDAGASILRRVQQTLSPPLAAFGFFSRLPVPSWVGYDSAGLERAARHFPLVGIVIGMLAGAMFWGASILWSGGVAALLCVMLSAYLTGALHEDGLADCVDGIGGSFGNRDKALTIMRDSRIGSFGAVALILTLALKVALLGSLSGVEGWVILVAGHAVSRFYPTLIMAALPYARESGKAEAMARTLTPQAIMVAALWAIVGLLPLACLGVVEGAPYDLRHWTSLGLALLVSALSALAMFRTLRRHLGGYTGDGLGAVQQVTELGFYLGWLARLSA